MGGGGFTLLHARPVPSQSHAPRDALSTTSSINMGGRGGDVIGGVRLQDGVLVEVMFLLRHWTFCDTLTRLSV